MTVKDLRDRLAGLPQDAVVVIEPIDYGNDARIEIWPVNSDRLLFSQVLDVVENGD
jgi:hypothetical protein